MDRKAKVGKSALLIIGIVYALLGGIFVALGIVLQIILRSYGAWFIGLIFSGIGSIFLVLGILFLYFVRARKKRNEKLLAQGRYVWGEIIDCVPNFNVRINHRHPYVATVRYMDPYGRIHIFKSESLNMYPDPTLIGKQVKIYREDDTFKHYYVDMDDVLPQFIEH